MYPGFDLYRILQALHENLLSQKERLASLEQSILRLGEAVRALQEKPSTHVDRIEYRFDQLKVEKLEGTLNIGITPQAGGTIEDYAVGSTCAQNVTQPPQETDDFRRIRELVHKYLDREAEPEIAELERRYNKIIGAEYRRMMIEDVRRQVDGRIREYLARRSASKEESGRNEEEGIVNKVKEDIRAALRTYIQNMPEQGGPSHGHAGS